MSPPESSQMPRPFVPVTVVLAVPQDSNHRAIGVCVCVLCMSSVYFYRYIQAQYVCSTGAVVHIFHTRIHKQALLYHN